MSCFTREDVTFPSADGKHTIAAYFYTPADIQIRAVIQISHGMCEFITRYEPFFELMTAAGLAVCGNDHLGHGNSATPEDYGYMADQNGYRFVLGDLKRMNTMTHEKFSELPVFMLGHSMGSFYARWYAEVYPDTINGLVISGTGGPNPALPAGCLLANLIAKIKGPRYISNLMVNMSTGSYCKGLEEENSPHAWLSRNPDIWEAYANEPRCTFPFTVSAYRDMLTVYKHVSSKSWASSLPKEMPVLLVSGQADPVGNYGKGVSVVYDMLKNADLKDITMKLYPGARHELHNELNRMEYFDDLFDWLSKHW